MAPEFCDFGILNDGLVVESGPGGNCNSREILIDIKILAKAFVILFLSGCSTLRDSLMLGAGTGVVVGGIVGGKSNGDRGENTIAGAVIGGVALGLVSYAIHQSLEGRDSRVRRETLMNLEHYEVLGVGGLRTDQDSSAIRSGKCTTTKDVDGRMVSIPCHLVLDPEDSRE